MKLQLTKDFKGSVFAELNLVQLNDIQVERLLPHLYELAIKNGRTASALKDPSIVAYNEKYLPALASRSELVGFRSDEGRDVLDGWLKASVVELGLQGEGRRDTKMGFIQPRTIAAYRAGFPSRTRHRGADLLIYRQMLGELERRRDAGLAPEGVSTQTWLSEIVQSSVGEGVAISSSPQWTPSYDGATPIDISTLLALYFLEGFEEKSVLKPNTTVLDPPVPGATSPIGRDAVNYLTSYGESVPPGSVAAHLSALIGLRLFQLPLRTTIAIRSLLQDGEMPEDMTSDSAANGLEQFVDFTNVKRSPSDELARACVQRDLGLVQTGFRDRLVLRTVKHALDHSATSPEDFESWSGPERIKHLCERTSDPELFPFLKIYFGDIVKLNSETEDEGARAFLQGIASSDLNPLERLVELLHEGTRRAGYNNAYKWFWSAAGLGKSIGVLAGTSGHKSTWTYAAGNGLLTALLAAIFADSSGLKPRAEMPLEDVLRALELDFGILIDRPPHTMDSATNRAAASENFEAFKHRLKLLGAFDGLSDDYSAQRVRNPLLNRKA